jgi:cellulose synthase/poly-beta-1,6-N-acetylglucosamine synthase-like glycosyltransferase
MSAFSSLSSVGWTALVSLFIATQVLYLLSMFLIGFFYTWPIDLVDPDLSDKDAYYPPVILFYPVLRELEETMRTTFHALDKMDYPRDKWRIVAIPNHDDHTTIASLQRLQQTFQWLEILAVPPTSHSSWNAVWREWENNKKVYWWHTGKRSKVRDLPPKKTRQLIYAFYNLCQAGAEDTLISYIDADSAPPPNYFRLGAAGAAKYDVVQLTNVAANVLASWASSFHAFDHMCWDASMYAHMSAHGKHPYYVLGKGLFFRSSDLHAFGGFHPWLTIEDPEVGMRLWTNGRRLGVVRQPLVEEVPGTFRLGVTQRKRWVCGFFQSLSNPLKQMGMSRSQRLRARLNLIPSLSLLVNPLGIAVGFSVLGLNIAGYHLIDRPLALLSAVNIVAVFIILAHNWLNAWRVSKLVLDSKRDRLRLALRLNPLFVLLYWIFWSVSIAIGIQMFVRDKGLVWERTVKVDANHDFVRESELVGAGNADQRVQEREQDLMIKHEPDAFLQTSKPLAINSATVDLPQELEGNSWLDDSLGRHRLVQYRATPRSLRGGIAPGRPTGRHRRDQDSSESPPAPASFRNGPPMSLAHRTGSNDGSFALERSGAKNLPGQAVTDETTVQLNGLAALHALSVSDQDRCMGDETIPLPRATGT